MRFIILALLLVLNIHFAFSQDKKELKIKIELLNAKNDLINELTPEPK